VLLWYVLVDCFKEIIQIDNSTKLYLRSTDQEYTNQTYLSKNTSWHTTDTM